MPSDERQLLVHAGPLVLEAIFAGAGRERGAVIAPPHPLYGGSMESPVVEEIAEACGRAGFASLRFNWRGVGASSGEPTGDAEAARADCAAALEELLHTLPGEVAACGYSFGAAAMLAAARGRERVQRLVLVAPPPPLVAADGLAAFAGAALLVSGERDPLAPPGAVSALAEAAPHGRAVTLPDADHFFAAGLSALGREVRGFLSGAGAE